MEAHQYWLLGLILYYNRDIPGIKQNHRRIVRAWFFLVCPLHCLIHMCYWNRGINEFDPSPYSVQGGGNAFGLPIDLIGQKRPGDWPANGQWISFVSYGHI